MHLTVHNYYFLTLGDEIIKGDEFLDYLDRNKWKRILWFPLNYPHEKEKIKLVEHPSGPMVFSCTVRREISYEEYQDKKKYKKDDYIKSRETVVEYEK